MVDDALLTDDLRILLGSFPNAALGDLVAVLKQYKYRGPFAARRAFDAHDLDSDGDFTAHATAIAQEILWWGSHEAHRLFSDTPRWVDVLTSLAKHVGVDEADRHPKLPAWRVEDAIFRKAMEAWERLTPAERETAIRQPGGSAGVAKGAAAAALGVIEAVGVRAMLAAIVPRAAGSAVPVAGPLLIAVGAAWAAYDLAGPGYRVLRPVTLLIAVNRRRLREARVAAAFQD